MIPIIRTKSLTREIGEQITARIVDGVDLEIQQGEFVAIIGPSGSGKSSLLYLLGLLDSPTSGDIWFEGVSTSGMTERQKSDIRLSNMGFVFQFHYLLPEFSALENITIPIKRLGILDSSGAMQRGMELLSKVGLEEHAYKKPGQLSGGQSQRVSLARSLANNPKVILADEPTGNLDSTSSANVRNLLKSLSTDQGRTIIVVTHDPIFSSMADRIIKIVDGKVVET